MFGFWKLCTLNKSVYKVDWFQVLQLLHFSSSPKHGAPYLLQYIFSGVILQVFLINMDPKHQDQFHHKMLSVSKWGLNAR